jgi:trigger factor
VVESVKTLHLPELNDEFAQSVGDFENVAKLREMVRVQLETQAKNEYEKTYFDDLIEKLVKEAKIKYAPQTLEHEMEHVVESIQQDLGQQHMELDTYLKTIKKEKAVWMEEEVKPAAKKRLERSLALDELAKIEKVEVGNEELQKEFTDMISEMQYGADAKQLQKELKSERFANALAMEAASRLLNRKILACLKDIATGKAAVKAAEKAVEPVAEAEAAAEKPAKTKKTAPKKVEPAAVSDATAEKPVKAAKTTRKAAPEAKSAAKKPVPAKTAAPKTSKTVKSDKK